MLNKTKLSVTHGDLAFAQYPVAVGHYLGDSITSAEAYLNRCLNDRLRQRYQLGIHPGEVGTTDVVLNPASHPSLGGAIVIGLGKVGELTPERLTKSFARAALVYALTIAEDSNGQSTTKENEPKFAPITTLLLGIGTGGLSVEDSVSAILRGLHHANLTLEKVGYDKYVVFNALEFIEIWQDLSISIARSLERSIGDSDLQARFDASDLLIRQVIGGKVRVAFNETYGWWNRLQILGHKDGSLQFNMLTDRARSELTLLPTQRLLVDQFISTAIANTASEQRIGRTLFELLTPNRLKAFAPDRQNVVLVLNEEAAYYPWELLEDRLSENGRPLAVESGVVRQLETSTYREKVLSALQNRALVIGDPISSMAPLPSAQEEANLVNFILLKNDYAVETKIRAKALDIVEVLYAGAYRILHLCGHGVFNRELPGTDKKVSGMVIGDDIFLTPADVEQMRQIPELVFINCCYLGRIEGEPATDGDRHKLAANLAAQFIRMGVRAVVAAGWAIDDQAAQTFASCFYEDMLSGCSFGKAVLNARRRTYDQHGGVNTWGAYQCYGDPGYSLLQQSTRSNVGSIGTTRLFNSAEVISELNNLVNEASTASPKQKENLKQRLEELTSKIPEHWLKIANVRANLGKAYASLEQLPEAIFHYEAIITAENSDYPISAIEQLSDLYAQWALQLWQTTQKGTFVDTDGSIQSESLQYIEQSISLLQKLCGIGETAERLSLLGTAYQRKAQVLTGDDRKNALKLMQQSHQKAANLLQEKTGKIDADSTLRWIAAEVALSWLDENQSNLPPQELLNQIQQVEALTTAQEGREAHASIAAISSKCLLLRHLLQEDLEVYANDVIQAINSAFHVNNKQELTSDLEKLGFLVEMLKDKTNSENSGLRAESLGRSLQSIYTSLAS